MLLYSSAPCLCICTQTSDDEAPLTVPFLHSSSEAPSGPEDLTMSARPYSSNNAASTLSSKWQQAREVVHEVFLPIAILLIGVGFSVAALYVAVLPMIER